MQYIHFSKPSTIDTMFTAGNKLLSFFLTGITSYKNVNGNVAYFLSLINRKSTVLDIGRHDPEYISFLIKISKCAKKLIAFEGNSNTYNYLLTKHKILKSNDITIHQLQSYQTENNSDLKSTQLLKKKEAFFNFYITPAKKANDKTNIDNYCITHNIQPDFLKINCDGNELIILQGLIETLVKYKPTILLRCEEGRTSRDEILQVFSFLRDLKYAGFFILDSIKIPTINFDFDIYQNRLSNFYCNDFIFE